MCFVYILVSIYVATRGPVKSDRLLDHALECKTIMKYLNLFAIDHCRFISHREHKVIRDNIDLRYAPGRTSSLYLLQESVWRILWRSSRDRL